MPLVSPANILSWSNLLPVFIITIGVYLGIQLKNKMGYIFVLISSIVIFTSSSYYGGLINSSFKLNSERTIFGFAQLSTPVKQIEKEALYLPYRLRPIVVTTTILTRAIIGNILKFLNFNNLIGVLLLNNFVCIAIGIVSAYKTNKQLFYKLLILFLSALIPAAIDRQPGTVYYLYPLLPILAYLMWVGAKKIGLTKSIGLLVIGLIWKWIK